MSRKRGNASSRVERPRVGLLGRGERQRALRPEQPEEFHEQAQPALAVALGLAEVRGREVEERVLAEHDELLAPRGAVADARLVAMAALEPPQHGEEVEAPGLVLELLSVAHSGAPRAGPRRPAHDLAALDRADHRLREVVERRVFRRRSGRGSRRAGTRRCPRRPCSSKRDGDLDAARRADAGALCGRGGRPAGCRRCALPRILRSVALSDRSANSDRISRSAWPFWPAPRSTRPRWLRLSMLISRQVTAPVCAVSRAAAQLPHDRLARRRRPGDADDVERDVVEQAEIGAALADRQMLGQVAVGAERAHAELGDVRLVADRRRARSAR